MLPSKECKRDKKCQKPNMSPPASPKHSAQTKKGSKRVTRVAGAGCHSVGVAAVEELGLEVKQVCCLAGFEVIST